MMTRYNRSHLYRDSGPPRYIQRGRYMWTAAILIFLGISMAFSYAASRYGKLLEFHHYFPLSLYLGFGGPTLVWIISEIRKTWRSMKLDGNLCRWCGYHLVGLTEDRCPECGAPDLQASRDAYRGLLVCPLVIRSAMWIWKLLCMNAG